MTGQADSANQDSKLHFLDYWRVLRVRLPIAVLIFLIISATAAVVTYALPKRYQSSTIMEVTQDDQKMDIFFGGEEGVTSDPRFATTQFQVLQRKEMLHPVLDRLGLTDRWRDSHGVRTREQAYSKLRGMIDVREVRNTNLLQVSVESEDPEEAAEIANAVAEEYQRKRIEDQQRIINDALAVLREEVDKQRQKVESAAGEMARVRKALGITDLNPDSDADPLQALDTVLLEQEGAVNEARVEASNLATKYAEIEKLSGDDLIRALPTLGIQDPIVEQILPQFQETEAELAQRLRSGLGAKHPAIRAIAAKKHAYQRQLEDQATSIRRTLAANLEITRSSLAAMEDQLKKAREEQRASRDRAGEYAEAKNAYGQAKKILEEAELRLSAETMQISMPRSPVTIWEKAEPSSEPSNPKVRLNIAFGLVLGLIGGVGMAFFLEYLDTSVKTMEEVESYLQVPVIAVIPQGTGLLPRGSGDGEQGEGYRILRNNIEFNRKTEETQVFTFVSGGAGEGKSTTLANLAWVFAEGGYRTLIIDADLRRSTQHRIFGVGNDLGLGNFLASEISMDEILRDTSKVGLSLITGGRSPSDPSGSLNSHRMVDLLAEARRRFDIVLLDSPPILGVSDSSVLVKAADAVVAVVQHRRFPRNMLLRVKQAVGNAGGSILGVVLNNVDIRHDDTYVYYTDYYGQYRRQVARSTPKKTAVPRDARC